MIFLMTKLALLYFISILFSMSISSSPASSVSHCGQRRNGNGFNISAWRLDGDVLKSQHFGGSVEIKGIFSANSNMI